MLHHYFRQAAHLTTQVAFARKRFKLLLRSTIGELDLRTQAVAAATNFFSMVVRPVVIEAPFGSSMLVVAPHQDDEVIGCGGAMALQRRTGRAAKAVVLQDGAHEHAQVSMTRDALREKRNAESRAAARVIDAEEPTFLARQDLRADAESTAIALHELIESRQVDAVFTPFVLDGHPDHRLCNVILAKALKDVRRRLRVLQYEVWATCIPNVVVVIDAVNEEKAKMLSCFEFANGAVNYAHATIGLNMFHSRLLPAGRARYVEAFFESPREEFLEMVEAVESAERRTVAKEAQLGTGGQAE